MTVISENIPEEMSRKIDNYCRIYDVDRHTFIMDAIAEKLIADYQKRFMRMTKDEMIEFLVTKSNY